MAECGVIGIRKLVVLGSDVKQSSVWYYDRKRMSRQWVVGRSARQFDMFPKKAMPEYKDESLEPRVKCGEWFCGENHREH